MKIIGIYKITNPKKKIYIGQSIDIIDRFNHYKSFNCKGQIKIYNSLKKYGVEKHKLEILCQCGREELNDLEIYYINLFNTFNSEYGLNLRAGGEQGGKCSDETRKKLSESHKGQIPANKGKKMTAEQKIKIGKAKKGNKNLLGFKFSDESKKKMSESHKGQKAWNKGGKCTEEHKKKISESNKGKKGTKYWLGRKQSKETINRRLETIIKNGGKGKKIINIKTEEKYNSIKDAAKIINMKSSTLRAMLSGQNKNKTDFNYLNK
jgi:hypothetical protein